MAEQKHYLTTLQQYANAPEGTTVRPVDGIKGYFIKMSDIWILHAGWTGLDWFRSEDMAGSSRRLTRWGWDT